MNRYQLKMLNHYEKKVSVTSEHNFFFLFSINSIFLFLVIKNIPAEPKTYANLFKSEVSSGISFASAMSNNSSVSTGHTSGSIRSSNISNSSSTYSRNQDMRSETTPPNSLPARSMNSRPIVRGKLLLFFQFSDNIYLFFNN